MSRARAGAGAGAAAAESSGLTHGFSVSSNAAGVKVYNLTAGKSIPEFLTPKQRRRLNQQAAFRNRIELLQDFEFPTSSTCARFSRDGEFFHIHELSELSLKCSRNIDAEVSQVRVLSNDFRKLVLMRVDRTIEMHAAYGRHYSVRVPKFGRDLLYQRHSCDLLVASSCSDIYRLNLEQGCFLAPLASRSPSVNCLDQSPLLHLVGAAGTDGVLEMWDTRSRASAARLRVSQSDELTSMRFDKDGLTFGVGTSAGACLLYDLRSSKPILRKQHQYGLPLTTIRFLANRTSSGDRLVLSADAKVIKIWKRGGSQPGHIFTTIEPSSPLTDVCMAPKWKGERTNDSGLLIVTGEQAKVMAYYVPELGPAPRWCRYLDNITEEMSFRTSSTSAYEDFKFLTREELSQLSLDHLIGTELLKAYMHGFFISTKLYNRARAVVEPLAYDQWRKEKIRERIEAKKGDLITRKRKLPKVNAQEALRIMALREEEEEKAEKEGEGEEEEEEKDDSMKKLVDDRFSSMFEDADFQIDENSEEWKLSHPSGITRKEKEMRSAAGLDSVARAANPERKSDYSSQNTKSKIKVQMLPGADADLVPSEKSRKRMAMEKRARKRKSKLTLAERIAEQEASERDEAKTRADSSAKGYLEFSYVPENVRKRRQKEEEQRRERNLRRVNKRSMKSLLPRQSTAWRRH
eukprot:g4667.t1